MGQRILQVAKLNNKKQLDSNFQQINHRKGGKPSGISSKHRQGDKQPKFSVSLSRV